MRIGEEVLGVSASIVQCGGAGIIVADPPRAAIRIRRCRGCARDSPRVFQVGVDNRGSLIRQVGDEVRLFVVLGRGWRWKQKKRKNKECRKLQRPAVRHARISFRTEISRETHPVSHRRKSAWLDSANWMQPACQGLFGAKSIFFRRRTKDLARLLGRE